MRAREAAEHLPYNERQLITFFGDREFDMPEIVTIRNTWMLDNLDLMNRFFFYEDNRQQLVDELMDDL